MPTRRGFLKALLTSVVGVAAADTLDVDRLLWEPGRKTIFDLWTPEPDWLAEKYVNTLVTPQWVMREMGRHLINNIQFATEMQRRFDEEVGHLMRVNLLRRYA